MTRSVEIPDKAVLQALAQIPRMRRVTIGEMREALVAALPYLAPAEPVVARNRVAEVLALKTGVTTQEGLRLADALFAAGVFHEAAPAGDGGLREALEELVDNADHYDTCSSLLNPDAGYECSCLLADIRALLAAHPAAPAVPQPVDREALAKALRACICASLPRPTCPSHGDEYARADAVLAVLAGEQEQVEK